MTTQYSRTNNKPTQGEAVVAKGIYRGKVRVERCVYEGGRFMAGGDFPIPPYELEDVTQWQALSDLPLPLNISEVFRD